MMFSRAASLRRFAAPAASSLLRPAAAASVLRSSPLSTTAKRAPKKESVPAPEAAPTTAPKKAAVKRAPRKAAVPSPEAAVATAPPQAVGDRLLSPHFDPAKVKRPTEIPFQLQIANTVHLVGTVGVLPVLEEKSPGEYQAVSVIVEKKDSVENDSLQLWIPVIFQGDLAQIAACHLKENDLVYIVGHLSGGEATTKVEDAHSKLRIFARSLSFVESNSRKDGKVSSEQDKKMASDHSAEDNSPTRPLWDDLLANPHNWWDNRGIMANPTSAAFKHKDEGQLLWLNEFTPKDVLSKLDTLAFYNNTPKKNEKSGNVEDESWWMDVFANPGDWKDDRINKQNGTVKPRYPDFKHKSSGQALWLSSAPGWVQSKLDGWKPFGSSELTHDSTCMNIYDVNDGRKTLLLNKKKEDLWKDVIENPTKWWDRRLNKRYPGAPDFKHKDSGDALWLDTSPSWVSEKLPPTRSIGNSEDLWKDVIENPAKWWDNRLKKPYPGAPDFKHKDSGDVLWLETSPSWVPEKLPPTESTANSEDLWKDVIENPTKWWDCRLNKGNPKAPDFKHKDNGNALWLSCSPSWVLEKLPPPGNITNLEDLWKDVIENPFKWWDKRLNKRNPKAPDFMHKDSGVALWLSTSPWWVLEKLPPTESPTNTDSWAKAAILA